MSVSILELGADFDDATADPHAERRDAKRASDAGQKLHFIYDGHRTQRSAHHGANESGPKVDTLSTHIQGLGRVVALRHDG